MSLFALIQFAQLILPYLSWLNHSRRFSTDYEISVSPAETMVKISHFHTLLKRL